MGSDRPIDSLAMDKGEQSTWEENNNNQEVAANSHWAEDLLLQASANNAQQSMVQRAVQPVRIAKGQP